MKKIFRRLMWWAAPYLVLPILLVDVPLSEIGRAWRNLGIRRQYRQNLILWNRERSKSFPEVEP